MRNAVIPAPVRIDHKGGEFALRSGTTIAYINIQVAPIVERFCSEVTRRMGLRVLPITGNPGSNEPSIRVELTTGDELRVLPAPSGVSPMGDRPCDERHSLVIDEHRVVVRAAEPVGVARGLSTLIQMLATTPSNSASEVSVPTGSEVLGKEFQDFRALAIDAHSRPWFLRLCFRLNRLGYRFVEQDLHRFLSCQHALFDQHAIERDRRVDGCHCKPRR